MTTTLPPSPAPRSPVDKPGVHRRGRGRGAFGGLALFVPLVLLVLLLQPVTVRSDSMEPTLSDGDLALVDRVSYHLRPPRWGELVAFRSPGTGELAVKRVVGVAGDRIAIEDGVLHVDGRPVTEPYVDHRWVDSVYYGPVKVPPATVLVMGDNRGRSVDSRSFGPVPLSALLGRVVTLP